MCGISKADRSALIDAVDAVLKIINSLPPRGCDRCGHFFEKDDTGCAIFGEMPPKEWLSHNDCDKWEEAIPF